jgi:predicted Zn-dependent peptidase
MNARRVALLLALLAAAGMAAAATPPADRSRPPQPGPARPLALPEIHRLALSNGLPVLLAEAHEVPTVEIALLIRTGAAADPLDHPGLASMTADMLDEGAGGKDALALADALDFLGAELTTGASWDSSRVRLHVPVARLGEALPLLADVALRPDFPEKDLARLRREALTDLLQARDEPGRVASWALARAVFGDRHRYGRPEAGDVPALTGMGVADLKAFHARHYRPGNAVLIVVGDVTAALLPQLERAFGSWPAGGEAPPSLPEPQQLEGRAIWLVDKPGAPQSVIRIGRVGPARRDPDFAALEVMNTLLGGSFTSRLNDNLRERNGYTYGAGSSFGYRRVAGLFLAGADVQTDKTAPALQEFLGELTRIRTPVTPAEAERAHNYLALGYAWEFETTRQLAAQIATQALYDLPSDAFTSFVPKALAVGPQEIRRAARGQVDPERLAVVVVGDRAAVEGPLRALKLGPVRVLSVDDVMGPPPRGE